MKHLKFVILFLLTLSQYFTFNLSAQENVSEMNLTGWRFGINIGVYFANKESAGFYNGRPENENNIQWVLDNKYWYEEIRQELNSHQILKNPDDIPYEWQGEYNIWRAENNVAPGDTTKWWIYYPDLKYKTPISPGFYLKYNFNNTTGIFIQSNYSKQKTKGIFQMVIDSINYVANPALRAGYIEGVEERVTIDIGISKFYPVAKFLSVQIETGFHMNSTKVKSHNIWIGSRQYTLVNRYGNTPYVPNSGMMPYDVYQGGIGLGIFFTGGIKFTPTPNVSIDPGLTFYYKKVNLTGYEGFSMDFYPFVRLIFSFYKNEE
jgi:hypothetical protein